MENKACSDPQPPNLGGSREACSDPQPPNLGGSREACSDPQPPNLGGSREACSDPQPPNLGGSREACSDPQPPNLGGSRRACSDPQPPNLGGSREACSDPQPPNLGGSRGSRTFKQLLIESFKSNDTEETLDVYFTRPIGLAFALMWIKIGVTPNFVTILSMFLGAGAGFCFYHTELWWNVCGVVLLMLANFCDSTDGQMARLTNHKTMIGRMLDGFASDVWFFCCYLAIALRLWNEPIPFLGGDVNWGIWGLLLCSFAGFYWHARQCQLADYYRQIHLYFIKGEEGSELNSTEGEQRIIDAIPKRKWGPFTIGDKGHFWEYVFHHFYIGWCRKQEKNTPQFQRFFREVKAKWPNAADMPADFREAFRRKSLPLMWMTNTLTHNTRAFVMFASCLANVPWVYPLFEITVLAALYYYMHYRHERMCQSPLS